MTSLISPWKCRPLKKMKLEYAPGSALHERDMARRWWALPAGVLLPLSNGERYRLLSPGRPGGSRGPDVLDAVFCSALSLPGQEEHRAGDVEFHLHASDWFAHLHQDDARYNNVILHVVLVLDDPAVALRQDGTSIPTCCLNDLPPVTGPAPAWPCQQGREQVDQGARAQLLRRAGLLRFEQKTRAFVELLDVAHSQGPFSSYDTCLISALAEGLGYGRDRAFFRAAGHYLLGMAAAVPEPLGRAPGPPPLDAGRLRALRDLVERWRSAGAWHTLRQALSGDTGIHQTIQRLRAAFAGLSTARTDILICNVVLPFAAAVALREGDDSLSERARLLYVRYPGLPSNQVTRAMSKQLLLQAEPRGACQQQGLHYIYQQTCREKRCTQCLARIF